jgi:hypothetical protein
MSRLIFILSAIGLLSERLEFFMSLPLHSSLMSSPKACLPACFKIFVPVLTSSQALFRLRGM